MKLPPPNTLKGFAIVAGITTLGALIIVPIIEQVFQAIFKKSAENVLSFGKAA